MGRRVVAGLVWGLAAAFFAAAFALQDVLRLDTVPPQAIRGTSILALCHFLGGGIAGWLLAPLFGRAGVGGVIATLAGAVLATPLGGLLGGAFAALWGTATRTSDSTTDLLRVVLGAITTPLAVAEMPVLFAGWLAAVVIAHLACRGAAQA